MVANTRAIALANGEKTYVGAPCSRGHEGERWVSTRNCIACEKRKRKPGQRLEDPAADPLWRNTYLALYAPGEFDRGGWRQVRHGGAE